MFGSWTYDAKQVDLKHMNQEAGNNVVELGIDLSEFYLSVEWDILDVPATKNVESYNPEMDENEHGGGEHEEKLLTDITFILTMRRKTLFSCSISPQTQGKRSPTVSPSSFRSLCSSSCWP